MRELRERRDRPPGYTRTRWAPPRQKPAKRRKKDKEGSR